MVHEGRRNRPALPNEQVHLLQRAARKHDLVPRPCGREHAPNVYAGLAGAYLIRDDQDTGEADNPLGLPAGPYEIPLVLQDKTFNDDGSMFYPTEGVTAISPRVGAGVLRRCRGRERQDLALPRHRAAPVSASGSSTGRNRASTTCSSPTRRAARHCPFTQIGAEGGLLRAPVSHERVVDCPGRARRPDRRFRGEARRFVQRHEQRQSAIPSGRAGGAVAALADPRQPAAPGRRLNHPGTNLQLPTLPFLPAPSVTRVQHLSETLDPLTEQSDPPERRGRTVPRRAERTCLRSRPSRRPSAVEDWLLVNTTADTHPIHLHLVTFEVVDRQAVRRRRLRPRDPGDQLHRARSTAAPTKTGAKTRFKPIPGR